MTTRPFIVQPQSYPPALDVLGARITVLAPNSATRSHEVTLQQGDEGVGPPPHCHPWDETFFVTCGRVDTALAHFEDGLAFCDRAGYRPEHAWTGSDYAEALRARGGPGDRERAVALQDTALATARDLEMRPLMERILARREILKA